MRRGFTSRRFFRIIAILALILVSGGIAFLQFRNSSTAKSTISYDFTKYPKEQMTRLTLEKVYSAKLPEGSGSLQGFTLTDRYFVLATRPTRRKDQNQLVVIRRKGLQNITSAKGNPTYNLGYANDLTWNSKTNEVVVIDHSRQKLHLLNDRSFKKTGSAQLTDASGNVLSGGGIAYDHELNRYYVSSGDQIRTFTKNQLVDEFTEKHNQTSQGLGYNNGYIYRVAWESAGGYPNSIYDGILKRNTTVIYQFDVFGGFVHAYYIDNPAYQVESIAFDENGVPYLAFNGPSKSFAIYKASNLSQLRQIRQNFVISYDTNGGDYAVYPLQTARVGTAKKLSNIIPTRHGFTFLGWSTDKNATIASYPAGGKFIKALGTKNEDVTLYAVWRAESYHIFYKANGGKNAPETQTTEFSVDAILSNKKPTRQGYVFLGWSPNKGATMPTYKASSTFELRKSTTLYAVWRKKAYTVIFNANGGVGAPSRQSVALGSKIFLSKTKPQRKGYTFLGWSTNPHASTVDYLPGAKYGGTSNATLFAVWRIQNGVHPVQQLTISYDANGGKHAPKSTTGIFGKTRIAVEQPERKNYKFLGWSLLPGASTAKYKPGSVYVENASRTLYAVWSLQRVSVSYDVNGGIGDIDTVKQDVGEEFRLSAAHPVRIGYKLIGWSRLKDSETADYYPSSMVRFYADTTLYAVWAHSGDVLNFDANGGTDAPVSAKISNGKAVVSMQNPVRGNNIFLGWSTQPDATRPEYQPGDIFDASNQKTLYAVWLSKTPTPIETIDNSAETDDSDEAIADASATNNGEEAGVSAITETKVSNNSINPVKLKMKLRGLILALLGVICVATGVYYWHRSCRALARVSKSHKKVNRTKKIQKTQKVQKTRRQNHRPVRYRKKVVRRRRPIVRI